MKLPIPAVRAPAKRNGLRAIRATLFLALPLLVASALLGACIPYSEHPLAGPGFEKTDPAILGTWGWREDDETGYVHFGLDRRSGLLRVVMVEFHGDADMKVSEFSGHTSRMEGNAYLNLTWIRPEDEPEGYFFVKYAVEKDSLGIALMTGAPVEKAIREGMLAGRVDDERAGSSVRITEGSEKLAQFVVSHDKELFEKLSYLHRTVPPRRTSQDPG